MSVISPAHLSIIYSEGLYSISPPEISINEENNNQFTEIKHLGQFNKNILILVNGKKSNDISTEEMTFLTKILHSVSLNLEDVAIVTVWKRERLPLFQKELPFKLLINFGFPSQEIDFKLNNDKYTIQNLDHVDFLNAHALTDIEQNIEYKKLLWKALKSIFN